MIAGAAEATLSVDERARLQRLLVIDPAEVGFVYFIQRGGTGPIKIGWTRRIEARLRELQTGNAERLTLRALAACSRSYERLVHKILAPFRISGEWFMCHPEVLSCIEEHQERFRRDPALLSFIEAQERYR